MTEEAKALVQKLWDADRLNYRHSHASHLEETSAFIDAEFAPVFKERDAYKARLEADNEALKLVVKERNELRRVLAAVNQTVDTLLAELTNWAVSPIARAAIQSSLSRLKRIAAVAEKLLEDPCSD